MTSIKVGVLASGRGSNLQSLIDAAERGDIDAEVAVVISDNEDAFALERAREHGIPAQYIAPGKFKTKLEPEIEQQYVQCLKDHGVELVCLAGFMRIIHEDMLNAFPNRILNIHPALLPSFPGLHAQKQALDYGVKWAGCTVHFATADFDQGPIIAQAAVPVKEDDTEETLAARILEQEHKIYPLAVQLFAEGRLQIEGRRVRVLL
ncbi:MAG: phosphoribosylglycinamide formyltransferase [Armatimonadota bacterium]